MKIKRTELERIVREEIMNFLGEELSEAPGVADADDDKKKKEKSGGKGEETPIKPHATPEKSNDGGDVDVPPGEEDAPEPPKDQEVEDKPKDDKSDEDDEDIDSAEDDERSAVADDLVGKTVQSMTMEPKSKILPGAMEIVITFNEVTDPLRILVTKTGSVKFFYRGLHNEL